MIAMKLLSQFKSYAKVLEEADIDATDYYCA